MVKTVKKQFGKAIAVIRSVNQRTINTIANDLQNTTQKLKPRQNYPKKPGMNPGALEE
jgi:site-specific recombinase XerD